ncbi:endonuclease III domain-containing protein [Blattabacterium cuenoti]|uniref:endonuclease III domain-containing protein n=1 Tax=Blattabacterium cuenoti TaxID=1653831 RepID=UPI00163CE247|nr:endonuclease III [Blattabacterium cuenoti]
MKKIKIIEKILNFLYPNPKDNLYYINEYTFLIAIILSSRCKEVDVNKVTKILFKKIQSPYDIIKFSIKTIKKYIRNLGLQNKKSKIIYNLSILLINNYNGFIPKNFIELKKLPGIGNKTASVFLSKFSNIKVFPIDTHINRMMYRWGLSDGKSISNTEKHAPFFFKKKNWKKLHLQILSYAKEYSPSKKWNKKKDIIYQELLDFKNSYTIKKANHRNHLMIKKKKMK